MPDWERTRGFMGTTGTKIGEVMNNGVWESHITDHIGIARARSKEELMNTNQPDMDKQVAEAADQIAAHLNGKEGTPDEIAEQLGLQVELVDHALMKHAGKFEWSIRGGDFKKVYKTR